MFRKEKDILQRTKKAILIDMLAIFIPLVFLGGLGWFVDTLRGSKPVFLFLGIGIAFIMTNIFIFFRFQRLSSQAQSLIPEEKEEVISRKE